MFLVQIDEEQSCDAHRHILFHKKHKSASSTMAAMFKEFSRKQKLVMAKTPVAAFMGGYPAPFDPTLVQRSKIYIFCEILFFSKFS